MTRDRSETEPALQESGEPAAQDMVAPPKDEAAEIVPILADATPIADEPSTLRPTTTHPELGWGWESGDPVEWRVIGEGALSNGHVEIYGTSGAGKTQFVKSLLAQLSSRWDRTSASATSRTTTASDFPAAGGRRVLRPLGQRAAIQPSRDRRPYAKDLSKD